MRSDFRIQPADLWLQTSARRVARPALHGCDSSWWSVVAQVSKPAVSPTSKSAELPIARQRRVWKPAIQQTLKSHPEYCPSLTRCCVAISLPPMSGLPFELLLALRYLRPKRTFVSIITLISIIGVALGVAVLIIVISVMSGFHEQLRDTILRISPHLRVFEP